MSRTGVSVKNFNDYLRITQAAKLLGVSVPTLRNWDTTKKLKASRHPVNGYRLYLKSDLQGLLKRVRPKTRK